MKVHEHLGSLISSDGTRNHEICKRIKESQSVSNEIVQVLKGVGLVKVRLRYCKMVVNACIDSKVQYGCGVWNRMNSTQVKELNEQKLKLLKGILEVPYSTPTDVVMY